MWELFDSEGLLSCTLSQLSDTVGVSDGLPENVESLAPLLSSVQKKRKKTDDEKDGGCTQGHQHQRKD